MTEPIVENGIPIVSAGEYGNNVGEAVMTISGGEVLSFKWRAVVMRGIEPDPEAEALIKPYAEKTGKAYGRIIGKCEADFQYGKDINKSETAIGNLTTEAVVRYVKGVLGKKADFALINSGTIRSGLPEGEISIWNILDILPFNNNITLVEIEGAGLIKFFRRLAAMPKGKKSFVQVSSDLRYTIDYTGGTGELKELYVKEETVSPGRMYSFATIDFITNGKGHSLKEDGKITDTGINLRQALIHYIERNKTVTPVTDGRIKVIE